MDKDPGAARGGHLVEHPLTAERYRRDPAPGCGSAGFHRCGMAGAAQCLQVNKRGCDRVRVLAGKQMSPTIILATAADQPDITASDKLYADALERRGYRVVGAPWEGPRAAFDGATAVVIRSTWGCYRAAESFRDWTEAMAADPSLQPHRAGALEPAQGLPSASLLRRVRGAALALRRRRDRCDRKRVHPNRLGARRREAGNGCEWLLGRAGGAVSGRGGRPASGRSPVGRRAGQEFLPEIEDGELSLVYFDGVFSHAVRKRPPKGEFRVNSRFGATRSAETPSHAVAEPGAKALRALPELPLYARVDGVIRDGELIVIEVEVLEPALFMEFDPAAAERFADGTMRRFDDCRLRDRRLRSSVTHPQDVRRPGDHDFRYRDRAQKSQIYAYAFTTIRSGRRLR